jgi:hypothetical protein
LRLKYSYIWIVKLEGEGWEGKKRREGLRGVAAERRKMFKGSRMGKGKGKGKEKGKREGKA